MKIPVVLIDDQVTILNAMEILLNQSESVQVKASFESSCDALKYNYDDVDIIICDVEIPEISGFQLIEQVSLKYPHISIIMLTTFAKPGYFERALDLNVRGYLTKDMSIDHLVKSIIKVANGQLVYSEKLRFESKINPNPLTMKDIRVLELVKLGLSNKQIAKKLSLSNGTVRNHLSVIMEKLHVNSRLNAVNKASSYGWLPPGE